MIKSVWQYNLQYENLLTVINSMLKFLQTPFCKLISPLDIGCPADFDTPGEFPADRRIEVVGVSGFLRGRPGFP